ncbi:uncharacterized, partial [Tachysurus ichikawai]
YPESTTDMSPLRSRSCGLHRSSFVGTQYTLRVDAEDTGPAQPVSVWNFHYAVTSLETWD